MPNKEYYYKVRLGLFELLRNFALLCYVLVAFRTYSRWNISLVFVDISRYHVYISRQSTSYRDPI